ncbi:hypothetical protein [Deinococcus wulumuqiensis]|uniref:IraD/Gp25-like domain-containing protein n=1 Tax=Deinococcus wulumuqiensis TaxID=980427 RepID=A0AAV4K5I6_9DEIO|nr:hypothetical protein [Deinococcus wulumuqiensis]QII20059.1 hypothetical protein G6R31_04235 [Deinococcus wulumuqiensis R12]GGI87293.1 hypothetical protein GCM10010914_22220 [Deinococcus wulumuqiensis]GGP29995.1 hypothetical protein GCM10008021_16460 [Deinococcus wulumuqiensis]
MTGDNLGVDFTLRSGLGSELTSGLPLLIESLARRLRTRKGALWYDPDYGSYLPEYLGESFQDGGAEAAAICELDLEEDPRVLNADATVEAVHLRGVSLRASVTTQTGVIDLVIEASSAHTLYPPEIEITPYGVG